MRTGLLAVVGAWLFAAAPILAQSPPPDTDAPANVDLSAKEPGLSNYWVRGEYLAYWVKNAPLPVSLTTGYGPNPTQQLLNTDQSFGVFSGFRAGVGAWLDPFNSFGLEGNFFGLQDRTRTFAANSDTLGSPTLAFPFSNQTPGAVGDTAMPIASPGLFAGGIQVTSTLQLWGGEVNSIFMMMREGGFELFGLVGARYVDLRETLNISTLSSDITTVPATLLSQTDQFNTRNQFYGGQVGARLNWEGDRFGLDVTAKFAIGATHQTVDIQGSSTQTGPGGVNGTFPGGFFTQTSNIGHYASNQFGMIPSVELKFSVFLTSQLRAFVGYDFLYWNRVVRPGSQIDHNINLTQSSVLGSGSLIGPAYPSVLFNRSDFLAQGVNVGFEFRF
jgi:hypothetical protein